MKARNTVPSNIGEFREAEELYETLAKSSPVGIYIFQDGRFCYVNPEFQKVTGYSEAELLSMDPIAVIHAEDRAKVIRYAMDLLEGKPCFPYEFRAINKDGKAHWGRVTTASITYKGKQAILGNFIDVTDSKRAEEAMRESEDKFSKVFSTSANAIGITSLATGKFIDVNDAFCRFTGYSREETVGHSAGDLNLWVKPEELARLLQKIKEDGRAYNINFTSRMKSGEIRIALASAEVINIRRNPCRIIMITDITELKKAEEKIAESEEKFSKAFRVSPEMVSITTLKDGKFIDANDSFINITGYAREEVIGHSVIELDFWAKTDERSRMLQILKEHGRVDGEALDFRMKSGKVRTWLFSAEQIRIGGELCLITMAIDITERKQIEEKLRESEQFTASLLENIPNPVSVINPDSSIKYVNPAFEEFSLLYPD